MHARTAFLLWHRWVGLVLAAFLTVVAASGAVLAFRPQLDRWLAPELHPATGEGPRLPLAELARAAEAIVSGGRVDAVLLPEPGVAAIVIEPGEVALNFDTLYLDPATGLELGRINQGGWPTQRGEITPFVYALHYQLVAGPAGQQALGYVAMAWTLDSFVALLLTLPHHGGGRAGWLQRWAAAWRIKRNAGRFRVTFDLHRAGGLWLVPALLVFAWSGVYMDLNSLYARLTGLVLDYEQPAWSRDFPPPSYLAVAMDWRAAEATGQRLIAELSQREGFVVERPVALYAMREKGLYEYTVRSSRDVGVRGGRTTVDFDFATGELRQVLIPTGAHSGESLTTWLVELHMANVVGLPYRIAVALFGLAVVGLSLTGVLVFARKLGARRAVWGRRVDVGERAARQP